MRLRARLLLLIGAALLPAIAVQVHFEREARASRAAMERAEALRLARLVSADLDSVIEGARQILAAMANLDVVTAGDPEACTRTLTALKRDVVRYASFSVVNAAGRIVCTANPAALGRDVSGRAYIRRIREEGGFAVGDYVVGVSAGRHSMHFALPLTAGRHGRDGAVVVALDLTWLARRLSEVPLPPGGSVVVTDRNGTVLGRWPEHDRFVGQPVTGGMRQALEGDAYRTLTTTDLDGVRRLHATGPLGAQPTGLFVGIGIDPAPAEAALAAANRRGLLLIAAGGLGALLLGFFAARRFMERPVQALVAAMERWRAGDLTARVAGDPRLGAPRGQNEFRDIALAFDQAAAAVEAREAALRETEARFRQIAEAIDEVLYIAEPGEPRAVYVSPAFERLFGLPAAALHRRIDALLQAVHPEDAPALRQLLEQPAPAAAEIEYRLRRPDGTERRLRHRCFPVQGAPGQRVVGVIGDVTEEREAAERQSLLAREVDHRAKNVLAVVQSILRLTRSDSPRAFAEAVEGRVAALARAHGLLARGRWGGAELAEVLAEEMAPYTGEARRQDTAGPRCALAGPPLLLRPDAVQPLAMVVHELATNAAKHGALSQPDGAVRIAWSVLPGVGGQGPQLRLRWEERGGPPLAGPPARAGFGSRVVATTVERQLGGTVRLDWAADGLCCTLALPAGRLLPALPPEQEPAAPAGPRGGSRAAAEDAMAGF